MSDINRLMMLNNNVVDAIAVKVMAKLEQREFNTYTVGQSELASGITTSVWLAHAHLIVSLPDLGFMHSLAHCDTAHPAVATTLDALSYGVHLHINLHRHLFNALPLQELSQLPLSLSDESGRVIYLFAGKVLAYGYARRLSKGGVLVKRQTPITPLAQDTLCEQQVQVIRQE